MLVVGYNESKLGQGVCLVRCNLPPALLAELPMKLERLTMPLSRHSVGTYQETSSHAFIKEHSVTVVSAHHHQCVKAGHHRNLVSFHW